MADIDEGLAALVIADPRLGRVIEAAGPVPLRLSEPGFSGLASIIVSQMVSRASADAIWGRITAAGPVTAATYLAHEPDIVARFGLSRAKASTLLSLAAAIEAGDFDLDAIPTLEAKQALQLMTALPGIGPWTAEVYLMFCGGHADLFPVGDVALQAAVAHAFGLAERPTPRALAEMAQGWQPWRAVAARLFWAYYGACMRRNVTPIA
jgi:DNA-3-methyladenine glycosylase II